MPSKKSCVKSKAQDIITHTDEPQYCTTCIICQKSLSNKDSIKCSLCKKHTHLDCLGLNKQISQLLNHLESCDVFTNLCTSCKPKLYLLDLLDQLELKKANITEANETNHINIAASLVALKEELKEELKETNETHQNNIAASLEALKEELKEELKETNETHQNNIAASLDALKETLKEELKEELKETIKEEIFNLKKDTLKKPDIPTASKHLSTQLPKLNPQPIPSNNPPNNPQINSNQTNTDIPVLIREAVERERKRPNAILFGLEASNVNNDITNVRSIIQNYHVQTISAEEIIDISRIGRDLKNNDGSVAPRMCRVICTNEASKRNFIRTINSLAKNHTDLKNLRCRPDLTIQQRARARELRTELKNRLENGEKNLYIDYLADCIKNKPFIRHLQRSTSILPQPSTITQD